MEMVHDLRYLRYDNQVDRCGGVSCGTSKAGTCVPGICYS